jgi:hypothetical protein
MRELAKGWTGGRDLATLNSADVSLLYPRAFRELLLGEVGLLAERHDLGRQPKLFAVGKQLCDRLRSFGIGLLLDVTDEPIEVAHVSLPSRARSGRKTLLGCTLSMCLDT